MSYGCGGSNYGVMSMPAAPPLGTTQAVPSSYLVAPPASSFNAAPSPYNGCGTTTIAAPAYSSSAQYADSYACGTQNVSACPPQYTTYSAPSAYTAPPTPTPQTYAAPPVPASPMPTHTVNAATSVQLPQNTFNFKSDADDAVDQLERNYGGNKDVYANNIENLISVLMEGQREMRTEIEKVKEQVNANYRELEDLRRFFQAPPQGQPPQQQQQQQFATGPVAVPMPSPVPAAAPAPAPASAKAPEEKKKVMPPANLRYDEKLQTLNGAMASMSSAGQYLTPSSAKPGKRRIC